MLPSTRIVPLLRTMRPTTSGETDSRVPSVTSPLTSTAPAPRTLTTPWALPPLSVPLALLPSDIDSALKSPPMTLMIPKAGFAPDELRRMVRPSKTDEASTIPLLMFIQPVAPPVFPLPV